MPRLRQRERVDDFKGGRLPRYDVIDSPDLLQPIRWSFIDRVEFVPLANGLAIPRSLSEPLYTRAGDCVAGAEVGVIDGKPACIAIHAHPPHELTMRTLRELAGIGEAVLAAVKREAVHVSRVNGKLVAERHSPAFGTPHSREIKADAEELVASPRRQTVDDDFLREVSAVYREATAKGESTQRAIQRRWPTSPTNARRWVAMARARGRETKDPRFLGEALGALTAGEQPTKGGRRGKTK